MSADGPAPAATEAPSGPSGFSVGGPQLTPDAEAVSPALERITSAHPDAAGRMRTDPELHRAVVAVTTASPWLTRMCLTDPLALDALTGLGADAPDRVRAGVAATSEPFERIRRLRNLGLLRIAARDLLGRSDLEVVGRSLSRLAQAVLAEALASIPAEGAQIAVVALGKLGAEELNYASDIDLILVGSESANSGSAPDGRLFLELVRAAWRVDLDLRPEGRAGAMVRTLDSYRAYWSRWAQTWEFQALLKARAVAGDAALGLRFEQAASEQVWDRPFGADELRELRRMKARSEHQVVRRNLAERELKRGPGGLRDIEFSLQLLQLVHGRDDPSVRAPATLDALHALAAGGYVSAEDAAALDGAYRYLRTVEHRLQLYEGQQVHTLPRSPDRRRHLALVMGCRPEGSRSAEQALDEHLRRHRSAARAIHERLFFRPLLEAFTSGPAPQRGVLPEEAVASRLAAFGYADAARTAQAVSELTRGFSRMSQLMQRMLPLLLDWLSTSPDPDQGLLGLRVLAGGAQSRDRLINVCRESPTAARQLCQLLGTSPRLARDLQRHPDALSGLASGAFPAARSLDDVKEQAIRSLSWRAGRGSAELGLRQFAVAERLRIAARDVLGLDDTDEVGRSLSDLAEAVITSALLHVRPDVPFSVVAMGRLGGREMGYGSDVDLLLVWGSTPGGGADAHGAQSAALSLLRLIAGESPATGTYQVDLTLRPEGRQGPPARSLAAYSAYFKRWAQPWERQALLRSRCVAGDLSVGQKFERLVEGFVWGSSLSSVDVLEIRRTKARMERERVPTGEDPKFHLKLGPGSLSDVEWTVQLLQLQHGIAEAGTMRALEDLVAAGAVSPADGAVLRESYRFCTGARNRLHLIRDVPAESLPVPGPTLSALARSLGFSPSGLRNEYTRVTRRARRVMERLFYGG